MAETDFLKFVTTYWHNNAGGVTEKINVYILHIVKGWQILDINIICSYIAQLSSQLLKLPSLQCQVSLSLSAGEQSALCQSVFHSLSRWVSVQHSRVSHLSPFLPITHSLTDTYIWPSLRNILEIPQSFIPQHMLPFNVHHALDTLGIFDDVWWVILTLRSRWIPLGEYSIVVYYVEPISISAHFEHYYAILFLTTGIQKSRVYPGSTVCVKWLFSVLSTIHEVLRSTLLIASCSSFALFYITLIQCTSF